MPEAPTTILLMERAGRMFGQRRAVADICLRADAGEAICVVGSNGAGKSTLLALAAGILAPDEGTVTICGERLDRSRQVRRHIGYMGDAPLVYDALSARENLLFYGRLYGLRHGSQRTDELLRQFDLHDRSDDPAGALSSGMRRRLDLARAIMHRPRLLLLDEPMNSLDPHGRQLIETLSAELCRTGSALVWTTHQPPQPSPMTGRVITITDGRLDGNLDAARANCRSDPEQ